MGNGKMMNVMDLGDISVVMVTYMKENGSMKKQMEMAYLQIVMELFTKVIGRMISKMGMVNKNGLTDFIMKANFWKARNKDLER